MPQQPAPAKEDDNVCKPAHRPTGDLHLVTDSAGEPLLDEEGFVTWVASPSPVKEERQASPSKAD